MVKPTQKSNTYFKNIKIISFFKIIRSVIYRLLVISHLMLAKVFQQLWTYKDVIIFLLTRQFKPILIGNLFQIRILQIE
ncbi:unnamed protein product, partial (macronuclear) [Paramecium tetraurelia]